MDCKRIIETRIAQHQDIIREIMDDQKLQAVIAEAAEAIIACFRNGGKVFFCGNGGSAADAQHLSAEFSGKFYIDRPALPSEALHCNTSYLTAAANDYSFDLVYSRLISGIARKGDILIGLSTSGNSKNILAAFSLCREKGITTIGFTGKAGGGMKECADLLVNVPSEDTPRIQEAHILIGHIICEWMESVLFGNNNM
ncbi:MAG: SIS domain-containing protein [Tannerellaceae bacterium]|jgi:D-sedoheptulose 7-phosphate isomerase|nr:SIS domain-containing protein [Tannerellaceae bacterium]